MSVALTDVRAMAAVASEGCPGEAVGSLESDLDGAQYGVTRSAVVVGDVATVGGSSDVQQAGNVLVPGDPRSLSSSRRFLALPVSDFQSSFRKSTACTKANNK